MEAKRVELSSKGGGIEKAVHFEREEGRAKKKKGRSDRGREMTQKVIVRTRQEGENKKGGTNCPKRTYCASCQK